MEEPESDEGEDDDEDAAADAEQDSEDEAQRRLKAASAADGKTQEGDKASKVENADEQADACVFVSSRIL